MDNANSFGPQVNQEKKPTTVDRFFEQIDVGNFGNVPRSVLTCRAPTTISVAGASDASRRSHKPPGLDSSSGASKKGEGSEISRALEDKPQSRAESR